jgi:hypothetical protein
MVVLEGQDLLGFLLGNGFSNVFLTPHGVDGDNGALKLQQVQQLGKAMISLDVSSTLGWPNSSRWALAYALTMWMAPWEAAWSKERRSQGDRIINFQQ